MRIILQLAYGNEELDLKLPKDQIVQARPKKVPPPRPIEELTSKALRDPVCTHRLRDIELENKRVVAMVADKYRTTPTSKVVPLLLGELEVAGVKPKKVTFVTGTSLHDKMNEEELARKLGDNILSEYEVIPHDAYEHEELRSLGTSDLGTPIWINRIVASADCFDYPKEMEHVQSIIK